MVQTVVERKPGQTIQKSGKQVSNKEETLQKDTGMLKSSQINLWVTRFKEFIGGDKQGCNHGQYISFGYN